MSKFLIIMSLFLLFISLPSVRANELERDNIEIIEFDRLTSKNINYVFKDLNVNLIEIEIRINNIIKTYRVETYRNDIEKELVKNVVSDLEKDNYRELSSIASIKGFRITKVKLRCSKKIRNVILQRVNEL